MIQCRVVSYTERWLLRKLKGDWGKATDQWAGRTSAALNTDNLTSLGRCKTL